ncbi:MAG: conjugal transfer protein TraG N-terminal domain-containing protein [Parachlamydiaceae bacterium]|nr:conjugal transfer protein TraG N-terminal domain-containing protein [Parachlamydiaceae bacterium]
MSDITLITYGGGEILRNIFEAIAQLMSNGKNGIPGIIWPIAIMTASIGGAWAISKAFFSSKVEIFVTHYILPLIAIPCFLMIPTTSITIEDVLKDVSYKVEHVPFFLAKFTELTSTIGYKLTQGMETVMHVPNDLSYNKTGIIFGAETALDITKFKVTNGTLDQNLHKFARQCIVYDLALGRYSLNDLKKTTDLWSFLQ